MTAKLDAWPDARKWWTAADDAELALLGNELVQAMAVHQERCPVCSSGSHERCASIQGAIDAVLDWRTARILRSRAIWARHEQTVSEEAKWAA